MVRRTRVRDYQKRDGTEVREHDRSLNTTDKRDRIVDQIRIDAVRRRQFEDEALNEALAEYADQRSDGATHEEALEKALVVLDGELNGGDFRMTDGDVTRLSGELEATTIKANERGYSEATSRSKRAPKKARKGSDRDNDEERMMSIGDALSDEDETFSFADVLEDGNERGETREDRAREKKREQEEDGILDTAVSGTRELGAWMQKRRDARTVAETRPNRTDLREQEVQRRAVQRRAAAGLEGSGPTGNVARPGYNLPVGVSTTDRSKQRVIRSDE
jgi:hypothetical protein